jgi:5-formyltetrahydrofolate cyclo-ligase
MGYGGGFYDTFLARLRPDARRIGIGFDLQVVERVPREAHDLGVDLVVTERRAIETGQPAGAETQGRAGAETQDRAGAES